MSKEILKNQEKPTPDYIQGLKNGIMLYAWWKDGIQYVGACGITLKEALEDIKLLYE